MDPAPVGDVTPFLDLDGCFNFRDLGGHRTEDGREVVHGRLYRADALHRLTPAGRTAYERLRIVTVIDLRTADEVNRQRWAPSAHWAGRWLHRPLRTAVPDWTSISPSRAADPALAVEHYQETVLAGARILADVVAELADPRALPAVFHCAAGKDRTGIVAAFLLRLLGVSIADVAEDYALSEQATARWEGSVAAGLEDDTQTSWSFVPAALMTADPWVMRALLEWVEAAHGTVAELLHQNGLTPNVPALLRHQLLGEAG
ncbi:tyrosine-protein phosphatase [Microlunatus flavus]|uniref:Protein-tyrosine phosphatase n=1 Tax=Microlunatus flavus TaxID=1036181 RepID=A0A1H9L6B4_9ACTN|nr:tyrosine-protein phosphatase [Microlunatus flavus]SER06984.1 protein-tyrosine phosphatase [Microlunatus flavus]